MKGCLACGKRWLCQPLLWKFVISPYPMSETSIGPTGCIIRSVGKRKASRHSNNNYLSGDWWRRCVRINTAPKTTEKVHHIFIAFAQIHMARPLRDGLHISSAAPPPPVARLYPLPTISYFASPLSVLVSLLASWLAPSPSSRIYILVPDPKYPTEIAKFGLCSVPSKREKAFGESLVNIFI